MVNQVFLCTFGILCLMAIFAPIHPSRGPEGMLYRSCMMGYGITSISSTFINVTTEGDRNLVDRKWDIHCGRLSIQTSGEFCRWGGKV